MIKFAAFKAQRLLVAGGSSLRVPPGNHCRTTTAATAQWTEKTLVVSLVCVLVTEPLDSIYFVVLTASSQLPPKLVANLVIAVLVRHRKYLSLVRAEFRTLA